MASPVRSEAPAHRTASPRPLVSNGTRATPMPYPRLVARTHYDELVLFLLTDGSDSRAVARSKLARLTDYQFHELSTDVTDELARRRDNSSPGEPPFLQPREEFHPKRNEARHKLGTLPRSRFKDLSSDVFFELGRRFPDVTQPEALSPQIHSGASSGNPK
ncbi:hypothetical protein DL93DRAFT_1336104 [Clavulina sp. PMI_390]|nr:hypothetical protein DL93DRAFT_1336104 [Clavulina sp. PMI_390]